jgi:hypothetical protein
MGTRQSILSPWPVGPAERRAVESAALGFVGATIATVTYLEPIPESFPLQKPGLAVAGMGLEWTTSSLSVYSAVWKNHGDDHALSLGPWPAESPQQRYWNGGTPRARELARFDATSSEAWKSLTGNAIVNVRLGWHLPRVDRAEAVWAFRLDFEVGRRVLVALGKSDARGAITYSADDVVVIFDEALAAAYEIPAQTSSAWG